MIKFLQITLFWTSQFHRLMRPHLILLRHECLSLLLWGVRPLVNDSQNSDVMPPDLKIWHGKCSKSCSCLLGASKSAKNTARFSSTISVDEHSLLLTVAHYSFCIFSCLSVTVLWKRCQWGSIVYIAWNDSCGILTNYLKSVHFDLLWPLLSSYVKESSK